MAANDYRRVDFIWYHHGGPDPQFHGPEGALPPPATRDPGRQIWLRDDGPWLSVQFRDAQGGVIATFTVPAAGVAFIREMD